MARSLDKHLDPSIGPKRILSLSGGGVRGLITLGVLERLEKMWEEETGLGEETRLSHHYDLIAGTSTGSIIATGLALGWRVSEIKRLYDELCPVLFKPNRRLGFFRPKFDVEPLEEMLDRHLGDLTLGSEQLRTGLLVCAKRMDTDSAWLLNNNPRGKYYDITDENQTWLPNKDYRLKDIILASAAAPSFLRPVKIQICSGRDEYDREVGAFVDGAISGHNCPALAAFQVAVLPSYRFGWKTGEQNLSILSIGTGQFRSRLDTDAYLSSRTVNQAIDALKGLVSESQRGTILAMQAMSRPRKGWYLNSEIEDLSEDLLLREPLFRFRHVDVNIERDDVQSHLRLNTASDSDLEKTIDYLRDMANGRQQNLVNCYRLGVSLGRDLHPDDLFM